MITPACADVLQKTWAYLVKHYSQFAVEEDPLVNTPIWQFLAQPEIRALRIRIDALACSGDDVATKQACRTYLERWRDWAKTQHTPM